ncbi:hypothetical protein C8J57DRAFT_1526720 [Mycena rebaudengoi]|nr:hypothetical protein C8J57DRAFT_1526720 [Mycena rebaudengoi]
MDSNISPSLPFDLEREIFEMAANRYPETIPALLLVAQRVLQWIEPIFYRTLVFKAKSPRDPAASWPESAKWAKYVQNMLIWAAASHGDFALLLPALEKMQLRQLTVDLQGLFELNFAELPALTHLCLSAHSTIGLISFTLANCSRLHMLVTMFKGLRYCKTRLPIDDPRFVVMSLSLEKSMEDWKFGAKGGRDFWFHAEKFVASRRRGEIEPGMSCRTRRNSPLTVLASLLAWRCWTEDSDLIN